jgi:lambda family phage portal protein
MSWWTKLLQPFYWGSKPAPESGWGGYEGAARGRRLRNFAPTNANINTLLSAEGDELRSRCRFLVRNNSWAKNALESYSANAIGTGIKPVSKHPDSATRAQLQEWWLRWTDECDANYATDYYGLQRQICEATLEAGECFVRLRQRPNSDGLFVPLQLQVLEAEHCPISKNEIADNSNPIVNGIEFDRRGRRTAYWMYRRHPGSTYVRLNPSEIVAVPAERILHQYRCRRPEQVRGEPLLVPIIVQLHELDAYEDAELVRKKTCAMISHFIRVVNPQDVPQIGTSVIPPPLQEDLTDVEPGTTAYLREGEDIVTSQSADVGHSYSDFMLMNLYRIAAGMGVTYEMLTGDLRRVNYSSIRSGQLEVRRRIEQYQFQVIVFQFCRPSWRAFLDACVFAGLLDAREFKKNMTDYLAVEWRTPAWAWVDPLKDVQAKILEVQNHFTSRDAVIHERGDDPEIVDQQIEDSEKRSGFAPEDAIAKVPQVPSAQQRAAERIPPLVQ